DEPPASRRVATGRAARRRPGSAITPPTIECRLLLDELLRVTLRDRNGVAARNLRPRSARPYSRRIGSSPFGARPPNGRHQRVSLRRHATPAAIGDLSRFGPPPPPRRLT